MSDPKQASTGRSLGSLKSLLTMSDTRQAITGRSLADLSQIAADGFRHTDASLALVQRG